MTRNCVSAILNVGLAALLAGCPGAGTGPSGNAAGQWGAGRADAIEAPSLGPDGTARVYFTGNLDARTPLAAPDALGKDAGAVDVRSEVVDGQGGRHELVWRFTRTRDGWTWGVLNQDPGVVDPQTGAPRAPRVVPGEQAMLAFAADGALAEPPPPPPVAPTVPMAPVVEVAWKMPDNPGQVVWASVRPVFGCAGCIGGVTQRAEPTSLRASARLDVTYDPLDLTVLDLRGTTFLALGDRLEGARFVRSAAFRLDAASRIVAVDHGAAPLYPGITVPAGGSHLVAGADGALTLRVGETPTPLGRVPIYTFAAPEKLERGADGTFRANAASGPPAVVPAAALAEGVRGLGPALVQGVRHVELPLGFGRTAP